MNELGRWLAVIGLAVGVAGESLLLHAVDLAHYCVGAGLVFAIVMAAALVTSLRAAHGDPSVALRIN